MTHPYQYVTLRCVPRVDRAEFLNVGVVLYSQSADLLLAAWSIDEARIRAISPTIDLDALERSLITIERICLGEIGAGLPDLPTMGKRFGWIAAPRSTVVQPGPLHGGQCPEPAAALADLMRRLVHPEVGP